MLHLDTSATLAKTLGTSGLTEQDLSATKGSLKRMIDECKSEAKKGEHAWMMDIDQEATIKQVRAVAKKIKDAGIQTVVWIGIGGSGLGPRVLQEACETPETIELLVVDTIDPAALDLYRTVVDWKHAEIVVVSKSGETLETMSAFFLFYESLKKAIGNKAASRVVAITDPMHGSLHQLALQERFDMLPIPAGVGGRYSIFTPVGLLPMALLGNDLSKFLQGAADMRDLCESAKIDENPAAQLAAVQYLLEHRKGCRLRVIMPYSARLQSMARWNQQLVAESLGKNEVGNPIPVAAIGTQDQHSLLQQWMQGPRASWHIFIREVEKTKLPIPRSLPDAWKLIAGKNFGTLLDALQDGTAQGLTAAKRPHVTIDITRVDAYHLGALFMMFLYEVVLLGKLYHIDPYGQPGVELSKKIAKEILAKESL